MYDIIGKIYDGNTMLHEIIKLSNKSHNYECKKKKRERIIDWFWVVQWLVKKMRKHK